MVDPAQIVIITIEAADAALNLFRLSDVDMSLVRACVEVRQQLCRRRACLPGNGVLIELDFFRI